MSIERTTGLGNGQTQSMPSSERSRAQLYDNLSKWFGTSLNAETAVKKTRLLAKLDIVTTRLGDRDRNSHNEVVAIKAMFEELLPRDSQDWEVMPLRHLARLEPASEDALDDHKAGSAGQRRHDANEALPPDRRSDTGEAMVGTTEAPFLIPYIANLIIEQEGGSWKDDAPPPRRARTAPAQEPEPVPAPAATPAHRDKSHSRSHVALALVALLAVAVVIGGGLAWRSNDSSDASGGVTTSITTAPIGSLCDEPPPDVAVGGGGSASSSSDTAAPNGLTAQMGVANVSAGAKDYGVTTAAAVDDVIKIQVRFENQSDAAIPDLWLRLAIPPEAAAKPRLEARLGAGGESVGLASPVTLSLTSARLQLILGSVKWRHNTAPEGEPPTYETTSLGDDVVFRNTAIENLPPGPDHAGTVTALVRVVADRVHIEALARAEAGDVPVAALTTEAGREVEQIVRFQNKGNSTLHGVVLLDNIPRGTSYIEASTHISRTDGSGSPSELVAMTDGIVDDRYPTGEGRPSGTRPGLPIGDVAVGQSVEVSFRLSVGADVPSGARLTNIALVSSPCTAYDHDESTILVL